VREEGDSAPCQVARLLLVALSSFFPEQTHTYSIAIEEKKWQGYPHVKRGMLDALS
jgi:hypothetical protein